MSEENYIIEMIDITKEFPGIIANENVTLKLKKNEIHALLGENGAGKSTLMSVLFGMYKPEKGVIKKDGKIVNIKNPNDANDLGIGMVHQHFKLVKNFTVLQNIILGVEETKSAILQMDNARKKIMELSDKYGLQIDPDALVEDISVGMQQRVEILKMLFRDNEILILDEPTAVLTPQEIEELMKIMRSLVDEGKSILFITHKLNEIKAVADRCTILRKGKYIDTVDVSTSSKEELSEKMVGRKVDLAVTKTESTAGEVVLQVDGVSVKDTLTGKQKVNDVSFDVKAGEIVSIAGIDGNGQFELIYALTGMGPLSAGKVYLKDEDITNLSIRKKNMAGVGHIPADRQKDGLVLQYLLEQNLILKSYHSNEYEKMGFIKFDKITEYADTLIESYDIRSAKGSKTIVESMSGGNQQKAIIAREIEENAQILMAIQPTRGLDVGAIEYIHKQLVKQRNEGKAILLVSFELDEVFNLSDRILVMYEGEIVAELDPNNTAIEELGLYMAGAKRDERRVGA